MTARPTLFHIPVCPFSQRVEILLALKDMTSAVAFRAVDITKPRAPELLAKTRGSTALPVLELEDGRVLHESLVILRYFEERFPEPAVFARDLWPRAVENMLVAREGAFVSAGYALVLNRDATQRDALRERLLTQYAALDAFLTFYGPGGFATPDDVEALEMVQRGISSTWREVPYSVMSRGMEKTGEQLNTDELHLRAFWIHWEKLMRIDDHDK